MENKWIFNAEQIEAQCESAHKSNPNLKRIEEIRYEIKKLAKELSLLITDDEKYLNVLNWFANTNEKNAAASLMSNQELGSHLILVFYQYIGNGMDEAIFNEMLNRLGYEDDIKK